MEKILAVILILVFFKLEAQTTNCWVSYDYVLMGDRFNKKGLKLVKGVKATFCFNNGAASFYTKETGLITFSYYDTGSGVDSSFHNQVWWEGTQLGGNDWIFRMTYNNKVWINNNNGWAVQLQKIYHSENGKVVFSGNPDTRKNKPKNGNEIKRDTSNHSPVLCLYGSGNGNVWDRFGAPYSEIKLTKDYTQYTQKFKDSTSLIDILFIKGYASKFTIKPGIKIVFNKDSITNYYYSNLHCKSNSSNDEIRSIIKNGKKIYVFGKENWSQTYFHEKNGFVEKIVIR